MGRPELGTKCACVACSERFYDLNRSPAICPKCGAQQPLTKPQVLRPFRNAVENRRLDRKPNLAVADDDVEQASSAEAEDEEDAADSEDEIDDGSEIDADHDKAPD